jgi:hypothetical protein
MKKGVRSGSRDREHKSELRIRGSESALICTDPQHWFARIWTMVTHCMQFQDQVLALMINQPFRNVKCQYISFRKFCRAELIIFK